MTTETTENAAAPGPGFNGTVLPWLIAAAGMILYFTTLCHHVTTGSVSELMELGRWDWHGISFGPLYYIVTYPARFMPFAWRLPMINGFAAVCGGLTLLLLARSVAILPQDRTEQQRDRQPDGSILMRGPLCWLPPVLAAIVCGLQLTFWENATSVTAKSSEIFDLLIFAYLIRCLLEYRLDEKETWLRRFALIYGLAMAENWAMIGFFPLFAAGVIWVKGLDIFNTRFLVRTFGLGLLGFMLVIVLPLAYSLSGLTEFSFWRLLHEFLAMDHRTYSTLSVLLRARREVLLEIGLTSVLPVCLLTIRWASLFGSEGKAGVVLAAAASHLVSISMLLACVWMALDPRESPRHMGEEIAQVWTIQAPFMTFYYLGALAAGYYSGYLLLVFGLRPVNPKIEVSPLMRLLGPVMTALVCVVAAAAAVFLIARNYPAIQVTHDPVQSEYFATVERQLPTKSAIILSDEPFHLWFLEAELERQGNPAGHILIDTASLWSTNYHRLLERRYPEIKGILEHIDRQYRYPTPPVILALLSTLSTNRPLYYLQPSFGYYFEQYYLRPHGIVYQLLQYRDAKVVPPMSANEIADNETFWKTQEKNKALERAAARLKTPIAMPPWIEWVENRLKLAMPADRDDLFVCNDYSRALDYWAVELQKNGQLANAGTNFNRALAVNPGNMVAGINGRFNAALQAGRKGALQEAGADRVLNGIGGIQNAMNFGGPFDEPSFCLDAGMEFATNGLFGQAIQEFQRARALATNTSPADLVLAQTYLWIGKNAEALKSAGEALRSSPNDSGALLLEGKAYLQLTNCAEAVAIFNRVIAMDKTTNWDAMLHRAIANYRLDNLDLAQRDYTTLWQVASNFYPINWGLASIADKKHDTNNAVRYYKLYLAYPPQNMDEVNGVRKRVKELEPGK